MKPVMTLTMDVRLLRIDSRLLHGQVATSWTKTTKVDRILVVSDDVAKDNLRKTLIMQAAPPGVKANVLTISKMLRIYYDSRFDFINAMILVENPVDAIRLISGGIKVPSVNIGSISFDATRKMVTDTIAVNHDDVTIFIWMHRRGIVLDYRKVPSDAKKDFWKCLCEKEFVHDTSQNLK